MKTDVLAALVRMESPLFEVPQGSATDREDKRCLRIIREALENGARLELLVNSPEIEDFLRGTKLEAAHQVEKWGDAHDRGKSGENWFWLVGYLAGKCLRAVITGKRDKALHHTISTAAACLNWHSAIKRDTSGSGIGQDDDIRPVEIARFEKSDREHLRYLGGSGHGASIPV